MEQPSPASLALNASKKHLVSMLGDILIEDHPYIKEQKDKGETNESIVEGLFDFELLIKNFKGLA